jgi:maltooligosyltrehalose trehalohydrolase
VRSPERGGLGLDAQWSDDFHHALHVALTGENTGYYKGFAEYRDGPAHALRRALARRFAFEGQYAPHRRRRHGAPAYDVSADHFVIFLQNHDQVGNRAAGDRLDALVSPDARKLTAALLLLAPYVPLLFMGEEYGDPAPFLYFVSHSDPGLVDAVRKGRREEFESFGWTADVPDPQAVETFERSRIHFELASQGEHAELRALYRELLAIRREEPALRPGAAEIHVSGTGDTVIMRLDAPRARSLLALFNLGGAEVTVPLRHDSGTWRLRFATHSAVTMGATHATIAHRGAAAEENGVTLPPLSAALYYLEAA